MVKCERLSHEKRRWEIGETTLGTIEYLLRAYSKCWVFLTSLFPIGTYETMATSRVETNRHL